MQNAALSSTERSDHCRATSSDHKSWRPLAVSEGDKVLSVDVTLLTRRCMYEQQLKLTDLV